MDEQQMQILADALWAYFHEKYLKPYLSDSVCYFMATVTTAPSGGVIGVQRPYDNAITLPYAWSAASLTVGDTCMVLMFGDMTNAIVVGDGALNEPGIYVTKAGLLQTTGTATDNTMSQDAITDALLDVGVWYGTSSTAAATQTKAVTISGITALTTGLGIRVKFDNAQTYNGQAKLDLNSLGAVNIVRNGTTATTQYEWKAGEVIDFVYDGTSWVIVDGATASTTYYGVTKLSSSTSSTSTTLAATASAVKAAYDLAAAKASVYSYSFAAADWTASGTVYTISLTASTHGCGISPMVELWKKNGSDYERVSGYPSEGWTMSVNASGDITMTASAAFDGKLIVR